MEQYLIYELLYIFIFYIGNAVGSVGCKESGGDGSKFKGLSYIDFHGVKVLADDECAKYTDAVDQSPATIALTALLTQLFPKEGLVCRCRSGPGQGKVS